MQDLIHSAAQVWGAIRDAVIGIALVLPSALIGRLLWHRRMARIGKRRFWSRDLLWELPMAVFCAVLGGGAAELLAVSGMAEHAVVGAVAWLGPRGLEAVLYSAANRGGMG